MSGQRDVSAIVADLRELAASWDPSEDDPETPPFVAELEREAADALQAADDASRMGWKIATKLGDDWRSLDALRPPCPTCGGTGTSEPVFSGSAIGYASIACPDCTDGKVPWGRMVKLWEMRADIVVVAEHVRTHCDRPYDEADRLLDYLRGIT